MQTDASSPSKPVESLPVTPPGIPKGRAGAQGEPLPPPVFELTVRVYYEDTDAGGIVYHANWLRFFERARTDWLRSLGVRHRELDSSDGLLLVVRDLTIDYRLPARLDDLLRVDVRVLEARRASMRLAQLAHDADSGELRVVTTMRIAAISRASGRPVAIPRWLTDKANG